MLLLQGDLDEAENTVNELNDEIPRQQDILEQVLSQCLFITLHDISLRRLIINLSFHLLITQSFYLQRWLFTCMSPRRFYNPPPLKLGMNLSEVSARAEALQDALIRADTKVTTLTARNDELEDSVKKVTK